MQGGHGTPILCQPARPILISAVLAAWLVQQLWASALVHAAACDSQLSCIPCSCLVCQ